MELARDFKGSSMSSREFRKKTFVVEIWVPMRETTGKALYELKQLALKVSRTAFRVYPSFNHRTRSWNTHGLIILASFRSS